MVDRLPAVRSTVDHDAVTAGEPFVSGELSGYQHQMAKKEGDFEKGEADGSRDALQLIAAAAKACDPSLEAG